MKARFTVAFTGPGSVAGPILALETSGRTGSVALGSLARQPEGTDVLLDLRGRLDSLRILGRRGLDDREEQASLLLPRVHELLQEAGVDSSDLSGIVVGAGPGSFTGVRVGVATAKGMARALEIPLWAFSSLASAALPPVESPAQEPPNPLRPRCVLFDARGDRVYGAAYRLTREGLEVLLEPRASTVQEMCGGLIPPGSCLLGEGATRHRPAFEGAGFEVLSAAWGSPSADALLQLLAMKPTTPPLADPGRWEPDYLRASGAERMKRTERG